MRTGISTLVKSALVAGSLVAAGGAANAASLVFAPGGGNLAPGEVDYANFDTTFGNTSGVSNAGVYTGTSGNAAQPAFGDQGDAYYAVLGGGSTTFTFDKATGSFSFDLGSADDYNSLTVYFAGGGSQTFSGIALNPPGPATGNQSIIGTNGRVTIYSYGDRMTSATFTSSSNSFEFDNLGLGAVPEPGVWAMLILGFGVIGGSLRRRSRVAFDARAALV